MTKDTSQSKERLGFKPRAARLQTTTQNSLYHRVASFLLKCSKGKQKKCQRPKTSEIPANTMAEEWYPLEGTLVAVFVLFSHRI